MRRRSFHLPPVGAAVSKSYNTGREAMRVAFVMLTPAEQRERIKQLGRAGWSPVALSGISGWPIERVNATICSASNTTTGGQKP